MYTFSDVIVPVLVSPAVSTFSDVIVPVLVCTAAKSGRLLAWIADTPGRAAIPPEDRNLSGASPLAAETCHLESVGSSTGSGGPGSQITGLRGSSKNGLREPSLIGLREQGLADPLGSLMTRVRVLPLNGVTESISVRELGVVKRSQLTCDGCLLMSEERGLLMTGAGGVLMTGAGGLLMTGAGGVLMTKAGGLLLTGAGGVLMTGAVGLLMT